MAVRAVIFDMDDTLTDWPAAIEHAFQSAFELVPDEHRRGLHGRFWQAVEELAFVWRDGLIIDREYWRTLVTPEEAWLPALGDVSQEQVEAIAQAFREKIRPEIFDDVVPTLERLVGRYELAVLSNNPFAPRVVERIGVLDHFGRVLSAEDEYRKPHPRAFQLAVDALEMKPDECAYVGDSYDNDLNGAHAAGLISIWLDRPGYDYHRPAGSHRIGSLLELPPLLQALS